MKLVHVAALLSGVTAITAIHVPLRLAELGLSGGTLLTWSALAWGAGLLTSAWMLPRQGRWGDRVGAKWNLARAAGGLVLAQVALFFAATPSAIVLARVFQGAVSGVIPAVWGLLLASKRSPGASGRLESWISGGALALPFVAAWAVASVGVRGAFGLGALLAMAALGGVLSLPTPSGRAVPRERSKHAELRPLARTAGLVEGAQSALELIWPVILVGLVTDPGLQSAWSAGIEVAGEGAYLLAAPWLARLAHRRPRAVFRGSLLVSAVCSVAAIFAPSPIWLLPLAAGSDGGAAGVHPILHDAARERLPGAPSEAAAVLGSAMRWGGAVAAGVVALSGLAGVGPILWVSGGVLFAVAAHGGTLPEGE